MISSCCFVFFCFVLFVEGGEKWENVVKEGKSVVDGWDHSLTVQKAVYDPSNYFAIHRKDAEIYEQLLKIDFEIAIGFFLLKAIYVGADVQNKRKRKNGKNRVYDHYGGNTPFDLYIQGEGRRPFGWLYSIQLFEVFEALTILYFKSFDREELMKDKSGTNMNDSITANLRLSKKIYYK